MHSVEVIEMSRNSPRLVSISDDFTQQEIKRRQRREKGEEKD